jgi:hypothetical protein
LRSDHRVHDFPQVLPPGNEIWQQDARNADQMASKTAIQPSSSSTVTLMKARISQPRRFALEAEDRVFC